MSNINNSSNEADVTLAKQIARRAVARHERKQAAKLNTAALRIAALESSLTVAQTTLGEQSAELRDAGEAVALLQERCASLETERDAAQADAHYHQKCFAQMLSAMQAANSGEYDHLTSVLRRKELQ